MVDDGTLDLKSGSKLKKKTGDAENREKTLLSKHVLFLRDFCLSENSRKPVAQNNSLRKL